MSWLVRFAFVVALGLGQVTPPLSTVGQPVVDAAHSRTRTSLNEGWSFRFDDPDSPGPWSTVELPHTWNVDPPANGRYQRGLGIYRRNLILERSAQPRRYYLYFEGANQVAEVYVNGELAGQHVGGYTAFVFDITDLVWVGDENRIEVLVDNSHNDNIPPLNADFTFYGGLYRDVWLIETSEIHIDVEDYAGPGVYVSTPLVSEASANVSVRVRVANDTQSSTEVGVNLAVAAPAGEALLSDSERVYVAAGAVATATFEFAVAEPALWSPEAPSLYNLDVQVHRDGRLVDAVGTTFGIRSVLVDGDGFYLNGLPYKLVGTNRHQDAEGIGNALTDAMHTRDMGIISNDGFNFVRLAHYPQDPAVLRAADSLGLAVWEEIPVVNTINVSREFGDNAERMLVEMVRQHGNHPSVVTWGVMNEALLRPPDPLPAGYRDSVRTLAERLHRVALREDPFRPTALAVSFHETFDGSRVSDATDILGMNLYFGWYYGSFDDMGVFLDSLHTTHPGRPLFVSEYGAGSDERVHTRAPVAFDFSSEHALAYHRSAWPQLHERGYLVGSAVWNQFDFGSAGRQDTRDGINQKGLYSFARVPKDQSWYYRAVMRDDPVLRIERDHPVRWTAPGLEYGHEVHVFTNADSVVVSNRNTGDRHTVSVTNGTATATLSLLAGNQRVVARGWWDGGVGESDSTTITLVDVAACAEACSWGINVGATYSYVDAAGRLFIPDAGLIPDTGLLPDPEPLLDGEPSDAAQPDTTNRTLRRTHHRIGGTNDDALYQSFREWADTGAVTVDTLAPGDYEVTLYFVETSDVGPGGRVFDVSVADELVAAGLDIAAEVGRWNAMERTFEITLMQAGPLQVRLDGVAGQPVLSAVALRRQ